MTFDADPRLNPVAHGGRALPRAELRPGGLHALPYAAIQAWAQRDRAGNIPEPHRHPGAARPRVQTVLGNIRFNEKGDTTTPAYRVYVWRGGRYAYVN